MKTNYPALKTGKDAKDGNLHKLSETPDTKDGNLSYTRDFLKTIEFYISEAEVSVFEELLRKSFKISALA